MDVFALLFILSFIALLVTLVVMSIRKRITFSRLINKGKGDFKEEVASSEISYGGKVYEPIVGKTTYETFWDLSTDFSDYWVDISKQGKGSSKSVPIIFDFGSSIDKWEKSLPHPSTRLKNRNKRKGKKK